MEPFPITLERLKPVPRRYSQILELHRVVQTEELSPRRSTQLRWKCSRGSRSLVVKQVIRERVSEGLDHIPILSEFDNSSTVKIMCLALDPDRSAIRISTRNDQFWPAQKPLNPVIIRWSYPEKGTPQWVNVRSTFETGNERGLTDQALNGALMTTDQRLMNRTQLIFSAHAHDAFLNALEVPPKDLPRMRRLLAERSALEQQDIHVAATLSIEFEA